MEVIDYQPHLAHHFDAINRQWIEQYFKIEPIDDELLRNAKEKIIDTGGAILFATENEEILGTVALKKHSQDSVELMKMGVYPSARNKGIGNILVNAAIEKAREMGFRTVVLYSNSKLENAIHLYRKMGFSEVTCRDDLYERCDIQMEIRIN